MNQQKEGGTFVYLLFYDNMEKGRDKNSRGKTVRKIEWEEGIDHHVI